MSIPKTQNAFTIVELVIVIIIVGVLASLALTRFFKLIEASRVTEALASFGVIRQAMERCYLMNNGSYVPCGLNSPGYGSNLSIDDPGNSPGAHFNYTVASGPTGPGATLSYAIWADRTTRDAAAGIAGKRIVMGFGGKGTVNSDGSITWSWPNDNQFYWDASDIYKGAIPH